MAAKKRNHSQRGGRLPKSLHFFRVILEETLESGKLRLPKLFCRKHEQHLGNLNFVSLKVPITGDLWKVRLAKCNNDEFWLKKGWNEFVSFYSIELGDFVVFKWEPRNCQFEVLIFNKTMAEIQYPTKCPTKVELSDEEDDVQVKEHVKNKESPLSSSCPWKKMKWSVGGNLIFSETRQPQQCSDFVSKQYPYFQTVIRRSGLNPGVMAVPVSFLRSYINMNCTNQILTFVSNGGESWPVKLSCRRQSMKSCIYGGLSKFLKENLVRVGDLCTFELIDREKMVFRVNIHRGKRRITHYDA